MIKFHGIPITGKDQPLFALQGKHACVSFASPDQAELVFELCASVMMDNGAFTTWKRGTEYDMEGYAEWVHKWHKHPAFDFYIIPDSIEGADEENIVMRGKWLQYVDSIVWAKGVPVWHFHESLDTLNILCNSFPRIALGSSGEYHHPGSKVWWKRMSEVMEVVCDSDGIPKTRLHGLRMLNNTITSQVPLASADSTNVARNIGLDVHWQGRYAPKSKRLRAALMIERIENHAVCARWAGHSGSEQNLELFG